MKIAVSVSLVVLAAAACEGPSRNASREAAGRALTPPSAGAHSSPGSPSQQSPASPRTDEQLFVALESSGGDDQIGRGLFGALVVEPRSGTPADRDYTLVLHGAAGASAVAINGSVGDLHLYARPGDTVRLRLVNAFAPGMDGGPEAPVLLGAPYRVVALDDRDLVQPQELSAERLPLGMGQRADLVFTMPATGSVQVVDLAEKGEAAFSVPTARPATVTIGDRPAPAAVDLSRVPLFDLTRYGQRAADPVAAAHANATYPIVLDAHPLGQPARVVVRAAAERRP